MDMGGNLWQLITPDGSYLANESTGGSRKSYIFRSVATGEVHATVPSGIGGSIGDAAFSPDGRYFAFPTEVTSRAPVVEVWDIQTGKRVSEINDIGKGGVLLLFSPDGKTIAGSLPSPVQMPEGKLVTDNKIVTWDTASGKAKQQLILGKDPARALAFSPDGRILAAGIGADIHLYDKESLHNTGSMSAGKSPVSALAFSPDGSRIAAGHEDGRVRLWEVAFPRGRDHDARLCFRRRGRGLSRVDRLYSRRSYDWSPGAASLIRWRYGGRLYPAGAFARTLRRREHCIKTQRVVIASCAAKQRLS